MRSMGANDGHGCSRWNSLATAGDLCSLMEARAASLLFTRGVSAEALPDPAAAKYDAPIIVRLAIRLRGRDSDKGHSARDCDD